MVGFYILKHIKKRKGKNSRKIFKKDKRKQVRGVISDWQC